MQQHSYSQNLTLLVEFTFSLYQEGLSSRSRGTNSIFSSNPCSHPSTRIKRFNLAAKTRITKVPLQSILLVISTHKQALRLLHNNTNINIQLASSKKHSIFAKLKSIKFRDFISQNFMQAIQKANQNKRPNSSSTRL